MLRAPSKVMHPLHDHYMQHVSYSGSVVEEESAAMHAAHPAPHPDPLHRPLLGCWGSCHRSSSAESTTITSGAPGPMLFGVLSSPSSWPEAPVAVLAWGLGLMALPTWRPCSLVGSTTVIQHR